MSDVLKHLIETLVEEALEEQNAISTGGAALTSTGNVSATGAGGGAWGSNAAMHDLMWSGDGPKNRTKKKKKLDEEDSSELSDLDEEFIGKKDGLSYFQMGASLPDNLYNRKKGKPSRDPGVPGVKKEQYREKSVPPDLFEQYREPGERWSPDQKKKIEAVRKALIMHYRMQIQDAMIEYIMDKLGWDSYNDIEEADIKMAIEPIRELFLRPHGSFVEFVNNKELRSHMPHGFNPMELEDLIDIVFMDWIDKGYLKPKTNLGTLRSNPTEDFWNYLVDKSFIQDFEYKIFGKPRGYKSPWGSLKKVFGFKEAFYHGSTQELEPGDYILPPSVTGKISEKGRKKNLDKVFVTQDPGSAKIYAGRAKHALGGSPNVYEVEPEGDVEWLNKTPGTTVAMAPKARVVKKLV